MLFILLLTFKSKTLINDLSLRSIVPFDIGPPPGLDPHRGQSLNQTDNIINEDKNYSKNNGNDNYNESDRKNDSNSRNESIVSHCSPFSFGFGL
jgi:hypothetical protein